jgi:DNA-binding NarL/FixJ family response regulator
MFSAPVPPRIAIVSSRLALRTMLSEALVSRLGSSPAEMYFDPDELLREPARLLTANVLIADLARTDHYWEMITKVRTGYRQCHVLVITGATGDYVAHRAMEAGATGMIHELDGLEEWIDGVRVVARGGCYQSATCVSSRASFAISTLLTAREHEVLPLVCRNLSDDRIGKRLGISPLTAEGHRSSVLRKLGLADAAALLAFGVAAGIVSPSEIEYRTRERRSAGGARR